MSVTLTPMGATCVIRWKDESPRSFNAYISFSGEYNYEMDTDEFGMPDDKIFYYMPKGIEELEKFNEDPNHDFIVLDFVIEYDCQETCHHGLSLWLCEDPISHYGRDM